MFVFMILKIHQQNKSNNFGFLDGARLYFLR